MELADSQNVCSVTNRITGSVTMGRAAKLIVLAAFDEDDLGDLRPAFEPKQIDSETRAVQEAKKIEADHAGVIAWSRSADPDVGEYGEPVVLFQAGKIPEME
jgi:hypothetical protein